MEKMTIIIPTIWMGEKLENLLVNLHQTERVDEIILIDNAPNNRNINTEDFTKINLLEMEVNVYVNPAWNIGVDVAKNDIICIMQDDLTCDTSFLNGVEVEDDTLIGISENCYKLAMSESERLAVFGTNSLDGDKFDNPILENTDRRNWGFATILLFKKENYVNIPTDLKIWCGDDFLFKKFKHKKIIVGMPLHTKMSTSSGNYEFDKIRNQDLINYEKYK